MSAGDGEREPGSKIGLALAGGGAEGALYEIGVLHAIDEAIAGLDLNALHVYVGVSAGSFVAAFLANGWTPAELWRGIGVEGERSGPFSPNLFYRPAIGEFLRRGASAPRLLLEGVTDFVRQPRDRGLFEALSRLSRALPVALFDNEPVRDYLARLFSSEGRSDDFRRLKRQLYVVAADLDSGHAVRFGSAGYDHVPISTAIQASSALPGLYPPVLIDGRYYVDGVLLKTLHASVAIESGADLLLCVNPIVPVDTARAVEAGVMRRGRLVHRGLPTVLAQTFRTLIRSRLSAGFRAYEPEYPDTDIVLLEPRRDDYRMFFTNVFSFAARQAVCRHAYINTRRELRERADEIRPILRKHGLDLRTELVEDESLERWNERDGRSYRTPATTRLDDALTRLEALLGSGRLT